MTFFRDFVTITLILLSAGCQLAPPGQLTAENRTTITKELEGRVSGYATAIRQRDLDYMLNFWANVDEFVYAGDGILTVGYDTLAEAIKKNIVDFPVVNSLTITNPHIYVLSRDAASYSMEFDWSMTSAEGDTTNARGSWVFVFSRFDDQWRVVHSAGTHLYF